MPSQRRFCGKKPKDNGVYYQNMSERQKARVVNCNFSQSFLVAEDRENPLTPDTVFVGEQGEIISHLTKENCGKYQPAPAKDNSLDAFINAITIKKPFLKFWTRQAPAVTCSVHSCQACQNHVVKKQF